jgi:putative ABC transport system permease protein
MLFQNLKGAFRSIEREKLNATVAVIGLAIGIMAAMLLASYCLYYHWYDRQIPAYQQWYRLRMDVKGETDHVRPSALFYINSVAPLIGEIKDVTGHVCIWNNTLDINLRCDDKPMQLGDVYFATGELVKDYGLKMVYGDPDSALYKDDCLILSRSLSTKLFGQENPVGEHLVFNGHNRYTISGVFEDLPPNMHQRSEAFTYWEESTPTGGEDDYYMSGFTMIRVPDAKAVPRVEKAMNDLLRTHPTLVPGGTTSTVHLDPLSRIHYMSGFEDDLKTLDPRAVYTVAILALLILLAALLNFINLVALGWRKRTDEFSFRRAMGASRGDLFAQLFVEYLVWFALALVLGIVLYTSLFGTFSRIVALPLATYSVLQLSYLPIVLGGLIVLGALSGLIASGRLAHTSVMTEEKRFCSKQTGNRIILFAQIVISAVFIVSALVVSAQMRFIRHRNLGFNPDNQIEYRYVAYSFPGGHYQSPQSVIDTLSAIPGVTGVSGCSFSVATDQLTNGTMQSTYEVPLTIEDKGVSRPAPARAFIARSGFLEKQGMTLMNGRQPEPDNLQETMVNEQFVRQYLKGQNPLGQVLRFPTENPDSLGSVTIVGVIGDTWFFPAYTPMPPMFLSFSMQGCEDFQIRYNPARKAEVIGAVERTFAEMTRPYIFGYRSKDVPATIREFYAEDDVYNRLTVFFALLIAAISAMGIYSVSSLHIRRQMKEIAIRKVCGAELRDLIAVFARPYLLILGAGGAVGLVLSHYLILLFLDRYTVQVAHVWPWFIAGFAILCVLVIVPLYLNIRRAFKADPTEFLQSE